MKKVIIYLFHFRLMQIRWGRKYIGGKFYLIDPRGLQMAPFWSDEIITSCQSVILEEEEYSVVSPEIKAYQRGYDKGYEDGWKHGALEQEKLDKKFIQK